MIEDIGAFVPGPRVRIEGRAGGPLAGLTFAAKDLFDIAGVPTGGGNHDWPTGRPLPDRHSWAVQTLLDAGATLIGKTVTDEVSLGILGENAFDGTPVNVRRARPRAGRLLIGLGCRRRRRDLRHRARHRHRRLGARAGELLRPLRHPPDPWPHRRHRHAAPGADLGHHRLVRARCRDLRQGVLGDAGRGNSRRAADAAGRGGRCLRLCRHQRRRRPSADGPKARRPAGRLARGGHGAAGIVGLGAGAAYTAAA